MSDDIEQRIVALVHENTERDGYAPSVRDIADWFGIARGTAQYHIERMVDKGLLKRAPGVARGIRVTGAAMKQETYDV